ncbi:MAG: hypothetical protein ACRC2A_04375 [Enterobacterales bacterium]|uniref:hypothetical protein n=1 Tax=Serratia sp. (in: enterobacteria) TaxID=616 RepID=UPI003F2E3A0F
MDILWEGKSHDHGLSLSLKEKELLFDMLSGTPLPILALKKMRSVKTLYTQRKRIFSKLRFDNTMDFLLATM